MNRKLRDQNKSVDAKKINNLYRNPIADFSDLRLYAQFVERSASEIELRADLWLGRYELFVGDHSALIQIRRGTIKLFIDGFSVVPGSRFGASTTANETSIQESHKTVSNFKLGASSRVSSDISSSGLKASGDSIFDASGKKEFANTTDYALKRVFVRVRAAGNESWVVSEIDGRPIDEQILDNTVLCRLRLIDGANKHFLQGVIRIRKDDIDISFSRKISCLSVNRKKIIGALLLRCLNADKVDNPGVLCVSLAELNYE